MARYIPTKEVAVLIRKHLKAVFPGVRFSVRSRLYAGGSSIDIRWTDGPTRKQVDEVVQKFQGADFDGMQDMKVYHGDVLLDGGDGPEEVTFGVDFVFTHREHSDSLDRMVRWMHVRRYGRAPVPHCPTETSWERRLRAATTYKPLAPSVAFADL